MLHINREKMADQVNDYLQVQMLESHFNGSVCIAADDDVLFQQCYGLANREHQVPHKIETVFRIGSISKSFTAAAIMQLKEQGLLDPHDLIGNYIPGIVNGDKITIHHLLTHTSGIPNMTKLPDWNPRVFVALEQQVEIFMGKPLEFSPGEQFRYSNSGYLLLAHIIECLSGKTYSQYIQEKILEPLNMQQTGCDNHIPIVLNRATGYEYHDGGYRHSDFIDMGLPVGGGSLYSTVNDLHLWDRAFYTNRLLTEQSLEQIFTPYEGNYGYGWFVYQMKTTNGQGRRIQCSGGIYGFQAHIDRFEKEGLVIILLNNVGNVPIGAISSRVANIVLGCYEHEQPVDLFIQVDE